MTLAKRFLVAGALAAPLVLAGCCGKAEAAANKTQEIRADREYVVKGLSGHQPDMLVREWTPLSNPEYVCMSTIQSRYNPPETYPTVCIPKAGRQP